VPTVGDSSVLRDLQTWKVVKAGGVSGEHRSVGRHRGGGDDQVVWPRAVCRIDEPP
jgi:hypothetical protein